MASLPEKYTGYNENYCTLGTKPFTAVTRGHLFTDTRTESETEVSVRFHAEARSGNSSCTAGRLRTFPVKIVVIANKLRGQEVSVEGGFNNCEFVGGNHKWQRTYKKLEHAQSIPVQMGYGYSPNKKLIWHYTDTVYLDVPALKRKSPGKPSIKVSPSKPTTNDLVTVSWSRNDSGTNMHFKEFRLYATGSDGIRKKIYSGSSTSFKVKAGDYTEPKGGTVTFNLEAIYLWDKKESSYSASISVEVVGGGCTVYDEGGNAHKALISLYDSQGNVHMALPAYYDAEGNVHNVI